MTTSTISPAVDSRRRAARRRCLALLLAAAALASCQGVPIGPVTHGCAGNPMRSQGSGCEDSSND